ncbi:MAG: hypothetical protein ABTD50_04925 [Polyangiaceae bacterium]
MAFRIAPFAMGAVGLLNCGGANTSDLETDSVTAQAVVRSGSTAPATHTRPMQEDPSLPPPSGGWSNYVMYSPSNAGKCNFLQDVSVTIEITQSIESNVGIGFQLNAYSPAGTKHVYTDGWQQYGMETDFTNSTLTGNGDLASTLLGWVEPWPLVVPAGDTAGDLIHQSWSLMSEPTPTLPAGTKYTISLGTDSSQNVRYVKFEVLDSSGHVISSTKSPLPKVDLVGLPLDYDVTETQHGKTITVDNPPATSADISPIVGFQLDIVAPAMRQAFFSQGAGTITYTSSANTPLQPTTWDAFSALQCANSLPGTYEYANTWYSQLPSTASSSISQNFGAQTLSSLPLHVPGRGITSALPFNQAAVYSVNQQGQLSVVDVPSFSAESYYGPSGQLRNDAPLATAPQVGTKFKGQTDVFSIDQYGNPVTFYTEASNSSYTFKQISTQGGLNPHSGIAVSQQFGLNQTDVFAITNNVSGPPNGDGQVGGQIVMYYVDGGGSWHGPVTISTPTFYFPQNGDVAASQQFDTPNQTDVFAVDIDGYLEVYSVQSNGEWQGMLAGAQYELPPGAPIAVSREFGNPNNPTDVFVVDANQNLMVFSEVNGDWPEQIISPQNANIPWAANLAVAGLSNQTDVFLVDSTGRLDMYWKVYGNGDWQGPLPISGAGFAPPGAYVTAVQDPTVANQIDVLVVDSAGCVDMYYWDMEEGMVGGGLWSGPLPQSECVGWER